MAIHYQVTDHVALITIDRYEKRNSMDRWHAQRMVEVWKEFRDDPHARVAVVTGVKNVFCSGGDLNDMARMAEQFAATGRSELAEAFGAGTGEYFTLKGIDIYKPIIAAVNGACMAGGMEMLGGTDIRLASTSATFSVTEPRRGLIASGGTIARLPRQLPWPAAAEILLMARPLSAERALQLGLINAVVSPADLLPTALEWAAEICRSAPLAVQATKKAALAGLAAATLQEAYDIEDACSATVTGTEDAREGTRAFLERRQPRWVGR